MGWPLCRRKTKKAGHTGPAFLISLRIADRLVRYLTEPDADAFTPALAWVSFRTPPARPTAALAWFSALAVALFTRPVAESAVPLTPFMAWVEFTLPCTLASPALVVTPPYVRPTQAGLAAHFRAVADDGALPVVLYNVPGRTGCDLLPDTVAGLAGHARIAGIKEARNEPQRMQALLPLRDDGFCVLSGDDPTAVRAMLAGADGVVSVASNVVPASFRRLCDLARGGEDAAAEALDARLRPLYDFLGIESNPIPLKALLARRGFGHGLRLPLTTLSPEHAALAERMAEVVDRLEADAAANDNAS